MTWYWIVRPEAGMSVIIMLLLPVASRAELAWHGAGIENPLAGTQPWVCGDADHPASPDKPCRADPRRDAGEGTAQLFFTRAGSNVAALVNATGCQA